MLDIAKEIINIRKELNLTQVQFAKLIGIEQPYLSKIESGKNIPTLETLSEIFSKLGYIMNVTVTKEENTVENKKSYPTSEIITLGFKNLVFRDEDPTEIKFNLYYRSLEYNEYEDDSFGYRYTLIKDERFRSFLEYLKVPTKTPKKVLLYITKHSEGFTCYLRLITNSNQYKNASYVDIDLSPIVIHDSNFSNKLTMIDLESTKEIKNTEDTLEEKVKEVESIVEKKSNSILSDYIQYLERLRRDDYEKHYDPLELNAKLVGVHILYFAVLGFSVEDVKRHYFERCASLK